MICKRIERLKHTLNSISAPDVKSIFLECIAVTMAKEFKRKYSRWRHTQFL